MRVSEYLIIHTQPCYYLWDLFILGTYHISMFSLFNVVSIIQSVSDSLFLWVPSQVGGCA